MDILSLFSGRHNKNRIKLSKSGDSWTVKRGQSILYMGSKERCEKYLEHHLMT